MKPVLTVVHGDNKPPLSGRDVLAEIAPIIADRLPAVPADDPWRTPLEALLRSATRKQRY